jgi:hypothetical protein
LTQIYPEIEYAFEDHHFQRTVGSIRIAVLLSHGRPEQPHTDTTKRPCNSNNAPNNSNPTGVKTIRSEKLLARVAACMDTTTDAGSGGTDEAARSVRTTDWFWFVIGGNVYLVSTINGVAYSGCCRDLLTFYLSTLHCK